jgi:hypothetical protein
MWYFHRENCEPEFGQRGYQGFQLKVQIQFTKGSLD